MFRVFSRHITFQKLHVRPIHLITGGIFAKGILRTHNHLEEIPQDTIPLSLRSIVILNGGFNHIWLFPYHVYTDYFNVPTVFDDKKDPIYIMYK
jgi:hypothetical protein